MQSPPQDICQIAGGKNMKKGQSVKKEMQNGKGRKGNDQGIETKK